LAWGGRVADEPFRERAKGRLCPLPGIQARREDALGDQASGKDKERVSRRGSPNPRSRGSGPSGSETPSGERPAERRRGPWGTRVASATGRADRFSPADDEPVLCSVHGISEKDDGAIPDRTHGLLCRRRRTRDESLLWTGRPSRMSPVATWNDSLREPFGTKRERPRHRRLLEANSLWPEPCRGVPVTFHFRPRLIQRPMGQA